LEWLADVFIDLGWTPYMPGYQSVAIYLLWAYLVYGIPELLDYSI
jgi:hypothetical protein